MLDRFRLDGRCAIVTASSRGIGAASAVALAGCGADVVLAARTMGDLEEVAAGVEATGRRAVPVCCDLSDLASLPLLVDAAMSTFGRLDVLVNNVGGTAPRPYLATTPGYLERAFHFNVTVAFELSKLAVPLLLESGSGSIVNVSSAMARLSDRGFVAYGTAKAALSHLTRLMAVDLGPRIRVNAVAPGTIETAAVAGFLDDAMREKMADATPLRRLGTPEEIADAIVYLAGAEFVTGTVLTIDGGLTAA